MGNTIVSDETAPYVIAEIGHNHQGRLEQALELIHAAADSGASAAKFQKRNNKQLYTEKAYNEVYNSENAFGLTYGLHREALEFGVEEYRICQREAKSRGIDFFATAFDFDSADFLNELDVSIFKIASGDIRNTPLIEHVARMNRTMILSTGGATFDIIKEAIQVIRRFHSNFAILQCTASYPADFRELNLQVIHSLRDRYPETVIGYSGHDNSISMPLVAYSLGARIIEKHFTLNRALKGTDHAFSLEPTGMKKMVRDLKRASLALGDGQKKIYDTEIQPIRKMGKMIVASRNLEVGAIIKASDLEYRSPADGLAPSFRDEIVGKTLLMSIDQGEPIQLAHIQ